MATKPTDNFTYATDANFLAGPDTGNPTKANPPGWPAVVQGEVPALGVVAAFTNKVRNVTGQWIQWLLAGSSAGAADVHLVETDASGDTALQNLEVNGTSITFVESPAADDITVTALTGTGANAGVSLTIEGQPGQAQAGGATNNNGGPVAIELGDKGTGGAGVAGDGFAGAALAGYFTKGYDGLNDTARSWEWAEGFHQIAGGPLKVLRVPIPTDLATYIIEVKVCSIESGGGAGLDYGVVKTAFAVKRQGLVLTIAAGVEIYNIVVGVADPVVSLTDNGDGTLDVEVNHNAPNLIDGNVYVKMYSGRISV